MSYRRAWLLLHSVNESFAEPSVTLSVGGKSGGGAQLTDFGRQLVQAYRQFESEVDALAARSFAAVNPASPAAVAAESRRPLQRKLTAEKPAGRRAKR